MSGITPIHAAACTPQQQPRQQPHNRISEAALSALAQKDEQIAALTHQVEQLKLNQQLQAFTNTNQKQMIIEQATLITQLQQQNLFLLATLRSHNLRTENLQQQLLPKFDLEQWKESINEIILLLESLKKHTETVNHPNVTRHIHLALNQCYTLQDIDPNLFQKRAYDHVVILFKHAPSTMTSDQPSSRQYTQQIQAIKNKIAEIRRKLSIIHKQGAIYTPST